MTSSSYDPSSTATDTDTNLPTIPTLSFPAPSPTPVSNPKDHGVGAPFYLAIVLASISFVGCVAAFIAWWIRSRARRRDLELDDPWSHRDTISDNGSPFPDNANAFERGVQKPAETQTRPYYLPASIVRRTSSNLLPVPHTIPIPEDGTPQNGTSRAVIDAGRYLSLHRVSDPRSNNSSSDPNPCLTIPSSQITNLHSRPGTERLQTGLSVQESTRTLGRLRVANRVPGDVTSGDEGGMNLPRPPNIPGLPRAANADGPGVSLVGENTAQNPHSEQSGRVVQEDDIPSEPPGPATLPWGRRTDTIAALRRTRRRTPGPDQTYKNTRYSGYSNPTLDGGPSDAMSQAPAAIKGTQKIQEYPPPDHLGWTSTLKSSFWQAVDAMTSSRISDPEPRLANGGSGSRLTPAPQRVASRRSPIRSATSTPFPDTHTVHSQETKPRLSDQPLATEEALQNSSRLNPGSSSTSRKELEVPRINEITIGRTGSDPPRVSRLNRDFGGGTHPDSLRVDTGSLYSTDSAAARANLRKYGYGDSISIPSSWSALGRTRESQLDLDRPFLPLPRPVSRSIPSPLPITPSQLTLDSGLPSSSVSTRTRTRTPMHSESDLIGSDANTSRSGNGANATSYGETTSSTYSVSRNGTVQSGHGTIGSRTVPSHSSSTASSMLSRKKGVTRKRPRPPPRAPSSASSVSIESGLSLRDVAVRRALLERRKKVKAAESLKSHEEGPSRTSSRDASSCVA